MLRIGSQKGFTVVEGLLIAIIVGLLGSTGWYVWHAKKNAEKNFSAANSSSSSTYSPKKKTTDSSSGNIASISPTSKPKTAQNPCDTTPSSHQNTPSASIANLGVTYCSLNIDGQKKVYFNKALENSLGGINLYITCYSSKGIDQGACSAPEGYPAKDGAPSLVSSREPLTINHATTLVISADNAQQAGCSQPFECGTHPQTEDYDRYNLNGWSITNTSDGLKVVVLYKFACKARSSGCWQ